MTMELFVGALSGKIHTTETCSSMSAAEEKELAVVETTVGTQQWAALGYVGCKLCGADAALQRLR